METRIKFWKWQQGRQEDCVYQKLPLYSFRIWKWGFDAYILKYAPETELPWHTDPVGNGKHYRVNYTLKGFASFMLKRGGHIYGGYSGVLFRPDVEPHKLFVYREGCTKLSLGFVKFK